MAWSGLCGHARRDRWHWLAFKTQLIRCAPHHVRGDIYGAETMVDDLKFALNTVRSLKSRGVTRFYDLGSVNKRSLDDVESDEQMDDPDGELADSEHEMSPPSRRPRLLPPVPETSLNPDVDVPGSVEYSPDELPLAPPTTTADETAVENQILEEVPEIAADPPETLPRMVTSSEPAAEQDPEGRSPSVARSPMATVPSPALAENCPQLDPATAALYEPANAEDEGFRQRRLRFERQERGLRTGRHPQKLVPTILVLELLLMMKVCSLRCFRLTIWIWPRFPLVGTWKMATSRWMSRLGTTGKFVLVAWWDIMWCLEGTSWVGTVCQKTSLLTPRSWIVSVSLWSKMATSGKLRQMLEKTHFLLFLIEHGRASRSFRSMVQLGGRWLCTLESQCRELGRPPKITRFSRIEKPRRTRTMWMRDFWVQMKGPCSKRLRWRSWRVSLTITFGSFRLWRRLPLRGRWRLESCWIGSRMKMAPLVQKPVSLSVAIQILMLLRERLTLRVLRLPDWPGRVSFLWLLHAVGRFGRQMCQLPFYKADLSQENFGWNCQMKLCRCLVPTRTRECCSWSLAMARLTPLVAGILRQSTACSNVGWHSILLTHAVSWSTSRWRTLMNMTIPHRRVLCLGRTVFVESSSCTSTTCLGLEMKVHGPITKQLRSWKVLSRFVSGKMEIPWSTVAVNWTRSVLQAGNSVTANTSRRWNRSLMIGDEIWATLWQRLRCHNSVDS